MNLSAPQDRSPFRERIKQGTSLRLRGGVVVVSVALLLAGCADGESDRRFANDPIPTEDILGQPTPPMATHIVQPTESPATPMTDKELLANTGAASNVFVSTDGLIRLVNAAGDPPTTVVNLESESLVTYGWSSNAERLALLSSRSSGSQLVLKILDRAGKVLAEHALDVSGSPVPAGFGQFRIAWSPLNDRLLLSLGTGGLIEVTETGNVRTILKPDVAPSIRAITWSPDGSTIAWVDAGPTGGATGLYVASIDALPVDPVTVIRPIEGRTRQIVDIAWGAGSAGIVYSERAPGGDLSIGGDLFSVSPSGGQPDLIATAGGVAQVGAIGTFAISPDGDTVVYSVIAPGKTGVIVYRLTLRQINGPASLDLPIPTGGSVEGFTWTTRGLAWTVLPIDITAGGPVVQLATTEGSVETLFTVPVAASPVASPEALASPVASPSAAATATASATVTASATSTAKP